MKTSLAEPRQLSNAYSIRELNDAIKNALSDAFPAKVWVHGEVSGYRENASGHVYFDLVEKDTEKHSVVAKISCFLPAGLASFIIHKFQAAGLPGLQDDIEIQVAGEISYYSPYGKLSLNIRDIEPAYTLGKMAQAREKMIEDLKSRGLLEKNKRHALPIVPLHIGLVTSDGSAAYHDFLKTLGGSGFAFSVRIASATMQGEGTERSVVEALKQLARDKNLDVVAIVRGGGSRSDLAWFDNQVIAETIAAFPKPVLTGIGHEIDLSIADMVAHTSFKTPTAVAEFLVSRVEDFLQNMDEKSAHIAHAVDSVLQSKNEIIRHTADQFAWQKISRIFMQARDQVARRMERTRALDPIQTLKRGFSLTRGPDGHLLRSVRNIRPGSMIQTIFADGQVESDVRNVSTRKGLM